MRTVPTLGGYAATTKEAGVTIPYDASGVVLVRGRQRSIAIGVPGGAATAGEKTADGIMFENALREDGSVSIVERIRTPTGKSVDVIQGSFSAPWAADANGVTVPTTYELRGTTLMQHVKPTGSTRFPVTADPSFDWGWTGLLVHWSRAEVKWLAGLSLASTAGALALLCAGPHAAGSI